MSIPSRSRGRIPATSARPGASPPLVEPPRQESLASRLASTKPASQGFGFGEVVTAGMSKNPEQAIKSEAVQRQVRDANDRAAEQNASGLSGYHANRLHQANRELKQRWTPYALYPTMAGAVPPAYTPQVQALHRVDTGGNEDAVTYEAKGFRFKDPGEALHEAQHYAELFAENNVKFDILTPERDGYFGLQFVAHKPTPASATPPLRKDPPHSAKTAAEAMYPSSSGPHQDRSAAMDVPGNKQPTPAQGAGFMVASKAGESINDVDNSLVGGKNVPEELQPRFRIGGKKVVLTRDDQTFSLGDGYYVAATKDRNDELMVGLYRRNKESGKLSQMAYLDKEKGWRGKSTGVVYGTNDPMDIIYQTSVVELNQKRRQKEGLWDWEKARMIAHDVPKMEAHIGYRFTVRTEPQDDPKLAPKEIISFQPNEDKPREEVAFYDDKEGWLSNETGRPYGTHDAQVVLSFERWRRGLGIDPNQQEEFAETVQKMFDNGFRSNADIKRQKELRYNQPPNLSQPPLYGWDEVDRNIETTIRENWFKWADRVRGSGDWDYKKRRNDHSWAQRERAANINYGATCVAAGHDPQLCLTSGGIFQGVSDTMNLRRPFSDSSGLPGDSNPSSCMGEPSDDCQQVIEGIRYGLDYLRRRGQQR